MHNSIPKGSHTELMTYDEIQAQLRHLLNEALKEQPRGYQARLAVQLDKPQGQVTHWFTGRRPIPTDMLEKVANHLSLELTLQPRK